MFVGVFEGWNISGTCLLLEFGRQTAALGRLVM